MKKNVTAGLGGALSSVTLAAFDSRRTNFEPILFDNE